MNCGEIWTTPAKSYFFTMRQSRPFPGYYFANGNCVATFQANRRRFDSKSEVESQWRPARKAAPCALNGPRRRKMARLCRKEDKQAYRSATPRAPCRVRCRQDCVETRLDRRGSFGVLFFAAVKELVQVAARSACKGLRSSACCMGRLNLECTDRLGVSNDL